MCERYDNKLANSDTAKKNAWEEYYQRLLNVEFELLGMRLCCLRLNPQ